MPDQTSKICPHCLELGRDRSCLYCDRPTVPLTAELRRKRLRAAAQKPAVTVTERT